MKNRIQNLFFLLLVSISLQAQDKKIETLAQHSDANLVVLNEEFIGNTEILNKLESKNIDELQILKITDSENFGENLFIEKSKGKVIWVKYNKATNFRLKKQSELNQFFGLEKSNNVYINGFLLKHKDYKIITQSISKIETIPADEVLLKKSVLNITIN